MFLAKLTMASLLLTACLQAGCTSGVSDASPQTNKQDKSQATVETPKSLIKVDELKKIITKSNLKVLEIGTKKEQFAKAHIEGAQFVHWVKDITDPEKNERYNIIGKSSFEKLLRRLGVKNNSHIVLYDDLNSRLSARMFWSLKYYGHENVQILDGGKGLWAKSQEMTNKTGSIESSDYTIKSVRKELKIDMKTVASQLNNPKTQLVDGRPPEQYSGEKPGKVFHTGKAHRKKGHIPGAVNICWKENFNQDGTFKSPAELKKLYKKRGISIEQATITYCNEGLHAAPPWYVLTELLNAKNVKLYDDSMCEWANSEQPVVKSKK